MNNVQVIYEYKVHINVMDSYETTLIPNSMSMRTQLSKLDLHSLMDDTLFITLFIRR
jgi:hypothetical protein